MTPFTSRQNLFRIACCKNDDITMSATQRNAATQLSATQ